MNNTSPMGSKSRKAWLVETSEDLCVRFQQKYINGQVEHGSDLGHVQLAELLKEMESEALDQLAYTAEIKRRFNQMHDFTPDVIRMAIAYRDGIELTIDDEDLLERLIRENNMTGFKYLK